MRSNAASNASRVAELIPDSDLIVLPDVGHYTFLAECGIMGRIVASSICVEEGGVSRSDTHRRVAEEARAFFDAKSLQGTVEALECALPHQL
jgi:hypothetical protein